MSGGTTTVLWGLPPEIVQNSTQTQSAQLFHSQLGIGRKDRLMCSSHRSISFCKSMPPPRESVTHWPMNWQSALIPSSSQELFFLLPSFCMSTVREPWTRSSNRSLSRDCNWFHLEPIAEENAAASFAHSSYKPRTNILTSDTKGILSHSHSFTPATTINLSLSCCLKEVSKFIFVAK